MTRRFVDLSVAFEDRPTSPAHHRPQIDYTDHDASFEGFSRAFGGVRREHLPEGKAWATEKVTLSTHAGTHMDAPYHYHPTTNHRRVPGGEPAATIDTVPLDRCFRPGVKLDFRHFAAGYVVTPEDIDAELARIGYAIRPLDIVLANTRAGTRHREPDYADSACGFGRAATLHLLEMGVEVVGTDSYSWDPAFAAVAARYRETGDAALLWEGHKAGRELPYWQMEKLCNLEQLPAFGFTVACFPVKIHKASAGWTRCVAILDG
jgi:kynurenine formamidase